MTDFREMFAFIEADLNHISDIYGIISDQQRDRLSRDMRYVFLDNIAQEIRFAFYAPDDSETIYFQNVYHRDGNVKRWGDGSSLGMEHIGNIAFDVFIEFTEPFLALEADKKALLLNNTELEWHTQT